MRVWRGGGGGGGVFLKVQVSSLLLIEAHNTFLS